MHKEARGKLAVWMLCGIVTVAAYAGAQRLTSMGLGLPADVGASVLERLLAALVLVGAFLWVFRGIHARPYQVAVPMLGMGLWIALVPAMDVWAYANAIPTRPDGNLAPNLWGSMLMRMMVLAVLACLTAWQWVRPAR